jgi:CIC family chloride channel protein
MVGIMGLFMPEVMGVGYDYVEKVLGGDMLLKTLVILAVLKTVATATCYGSGNAGGIFGPSLFIGAMWGGAVGSIAHHFFPVWTAGPGAYALVGMGAAFAGIVRTPLTSVIMIFEMTRDYSIIVPLMIANLISFFISYRLQRQPIYEALAHQEGVYLPGDETRTHLTRLKVSDIIREDQPLLADTLLAALSQRLNDTGRNAWPVMRDSKLYGLLTRNQMLAAVGAATVGEAILPRSSTPSIYLDQPLSFALEKMGAAGIDVLPVVSRADAAQLLGIVTLQDTLEAYGLGQETWPQAT